jgi:hypothetical protein
MSTAFIEGTGTHGAWTVDAFSGLCSNTLTMPAPGEPIDHLRDRADIILQIRIRTADSIALGSKQTGQQGVPRARVAAELDPGSKELSYFSINGRSCQLACRRFVNPIDLQRAEQRPFPLPIFQQAVDNRPIRVPRPRPRAIGNDPIATSPNRLSPRTRTRSGIRYLLGYT